MQPHLPIFYHKTHHYIVFCHLMVHNFSQHNCKLSEDGALTPKHVGVTLI